jgi:flagellin-like protein
MMRKMFKSRKALSPVVASIILIAVTVAVAIAVAAWMGALTVGFMGGTEQLNIIDVRYDNATKTVYIEVSNTGGGTITITDIRIDDVTYKNYTDNIDPKLPYDLPKGESKTFTITFNKWPFKSGTKYYFKVITAKGNSFGPYEKIAPS